MRTRLSTTLRNPYGNAVQGSLDSRQMFAAFNSDLPPAIVSSREKSALLGRSCPLARLIEIPSRGKLTKREGRPMLAKVDRKAPSISAGVNSISPAGIGSHCSGFCPRRLHHSLKPSSMSRAYLCPTGSIAFRLCERGRVVKWWVFAVRGRGWWELSRCSIGRVGSREGGFEAPRRRSR